MTTITRVISNAGAALTRPDGSPLAFVQVSFSLVNAVGTPCDAFDAIDSSRIVGAVLATTDASGFFTAALWPNDRGTTATQYVCTVDYPGVGGFLAAMPSGLNSFSWLQFKNSGIPLTQANIDALTAYMAQLAAQVALASAQADTATAEAAIASAKAALTAQDVTSTHADVVLTHADVATTHSDVVLTHEDVATTQGLATVASTAATDATGAAAALNAALASFRSKYLGSFAADPTVDGNGDALTIGAEYFNSVSNKLRIYSASGWADYDAAAQTEVTNAALSAAAAAGSASSANSFQQQAGMYAAAALASQNASAASAGNSQTSATASSNSANLAASSVLSQLTSLLTQTQAARDAALAGLGAADQSLNLAALSSGLQLALDWAGQANQVSLVSILSQVNTLVISLIPLTITQTEVLESAIAVALDLIGVTVKQINSGAFQQVDISGTKLRIRTSNTVTAATAAGNAGEWCWDSSFIYVCTATNSWKRTPLTAW